MSKRKLPTPSVIVLLILQASALLLYPPSYFQRSPQALVVPPVLLIFLALALVGINTETLSPSGGRSLLIFIQGINIVVRAMTLFPNLKTPDGDWAWVLLILQAVGMAISWYTMLELENVSMDGLRWEKLASKAG